MNLLPKCHKEFSEKDYWNKFFKKRGNKAFEWYGEYLELCSQLHKYLKQKDLILVPGCGNSSLSADLYDVGFQNITNIDVSEVVIKQMTKLNSNRKNMKFLCMDAMNTTFENESFNVVLDKGTLDALMPDDTEETIVQIDKYFAEIKRVLKFGGRFVCISLLQSHILTKLVSTFCDRSWMFRIVRCHEAEQKNAEDGDGMTLPVFVVVATKFKEMPHLLVEVCMAGDKMQRVQSAEELKSHVKSAQDAAFVTNGLARTSLEDNEVSLDLMQPGEDIPRYTLYVMDQKEPAPNKYAVFIVPQGRDSEWLFGTRAGRKHLQKSAKFCRMVVVALRRGHSFASLTAVKEELAHTAKMLIPNGFAGQIPFLSLGSDVGHRTEVARGHSEHSGDFVVEDVAVEGSTHRRLVFLNNQQLVQSEARLKDVKRKNKTGITVDFGYISAYHSFMCVCASLVRRNKSGDVRRAAVLGLGGGGLCMFLRKCWADVKITAVDIDPVMLEVAREHFQLKTNENLQVQIEDGLDFLKDEAAKGTSFDILFYDIDSKDSSLGLSCPPKQFVEDEVIQYLTTLLGDNGHFVLNLVCRDTLLTAKIIVTIKKHFKYAISIQLYEEVNNIIYATNSRPYVIEELEVAAQALNGTARQRTLVDIKNALARDNRQSGQRDPEPQHRVAVPAQQVPGPAHQDPGPAHQDPGQAHPVPEPAHQVPVPAHQVPVPAHQVPGPAHQDPGQAYQVPVPALQVTGPDHQVPVPAHQVPGPAHQDPGQAHPVPGPAHQVPVPAHQVTGPAHQDPGQAHQIPVPARQVPVPAHQVPGSAHQDPGQAHQVPVLAVQDPGQAYQVPGPTQLVPGSQRQISGISNCVPGPSAWVPVILQRCPGTSHRVPGPPHWFPVPLYRCSGTHHRAPRPQHQVSGAQHQVPGPQHQVPGAQHQVPGPQHQVPGPQHQAPGAQHQVPGAQHQVPGAQHQVPGAQHQVPGPQQEVSGISNRVPGPSHNVMGPQHQFNSYGLLKFGILIPGSSRMVPGPLHRVPGPSHCVSGPSNRVLEPSQRGDQEVPEIEVPSPED